MVIAFGSMQAQTWQTLGDFPVWSAPADGQAALTSGFLQPNLWVNPPIVDTVEVEDTAPFVFDPHERHSPYAPFTFDSSAATSTGWYRYHVCEPYHNGLRIDSVFVLFPSIPDTAGHDPGDTLPVPPPATSSSPLIVNLVVLDHQGLSFFKILNLGDYEGAELTLFDPAGRAVYKNRDYRNDFDFAGRVPGTYYYHLRLREGGKTSRHDGFVEVIQHP